MARRTTTAYLDKKLAIITKGEWRERHEDKDYALLHETVTKNCVVQATWSGRIENAHRTPKAKWAPFALEVSVIMRTDGDGRELSEPVIKRDELACESFVTLADLEAGYKAFLKKYTEKEFTGTLGMGKDDPAPPPPPPAYEPEEEDDDYHGDELAGEDETEAKPEPDPVATPGSDVVSGGAFAGEW